MKTFPRSALLILCSFLFFRPSVQGSEGRAVQVQVGILDVPAAAGGTAGSTEFVALRRIFDIQGVPYRVMTDTLQLGSCRVVYTGGMLTNATVSAGMADALYEYVELGGVLVAAGEIGNRLYPLFGVQGHEPSRRRYRLHFTGNDDSVIYLDHPSEKTISLGNGGGHFFDEVIWSHGFQPAEGSAPLARFEDGSTGFLKNRYGRGYTYLLGLSYSESVLLPQLGGDFEAQRRFVNSVEPSADVIMLILKAVYESTCRPAVYLSTAPYAKQTALILSHDVDAQTSFVDSLKFAALEKRYGVKSTFFMNTKYFKDRMDTDYYNIDENIRAIRSLHSTGSEIGSHTVSHSRQFAQSAEGDPDVSFATYDPREEVTVQGEVRVSKELLERDVPGLNVLSFRAGYLEFPHALIRVLEGSGYRYDSTCSANDVLTGFPYMATRERHLGSPESKVIELPVTLDDSLGYLTPDTEASATQAWLEIIAAYRDNEAITVLLIHPSDTRTASYKLQAEERLLQVVSAMDGWIGDVGTFGNFWRDRNETDFTVYERTDGTLVIRVNEEKTVLNPAVGFVIANSGTRKVVVVDRENTALPFRVTERSGKLFVGRFER
jgi:peptidoglycan/xylan/chitin deacetylase (PgdA/CDA1 family)